MTYFIFALCAGMALTGCGKTTATESSNVKAVMECDSLPEAVKNLVKAVADNDSVTFANLVSYPLQRPYPLRDIENAEEMKAYYSTLVDDSLQNVVTKATPDRWSEYGWRGWSLDDGRYIWVDESLYDVQYISQKEQKILDSLNNEELKTIAPSIRDGWKPILCLRDNSKGETYRIDIRTSAEKKDGRHYRLAAYAKGQNLRDVPAELLEGVMETDGTAGIVIYRFFDKNGKEYVVEPDAPDNASPILINPNDSVTELSRAYWHELVNRN